MVIDKLEYHFLFSFNSKIPGPPNYRQNQGQTAASLKKSMGKITNPKKQG
jgi:hypothetical protein